MLDNRFYEMHLGGKNQIDSEKTVQWQMLLERKKLRIS